MDGRLAKNRNKAKDEGDEKDGPCGFKAQFFSNYISNRSHNGRGRGEEENQADIRDSKANQQFENGMTGEVDEQYVVDEEDDKNKAKDLKVESLDDLFEDNTEEEKEKVTVTSEKTDNSKLSVDTLLDEEAPVLPMDSEPEEEYDLQKELEAKFDELFGPIDDDE